jgi:hypothetical protein
MLQYGYSHKASTKLQSKTMNILSQELRDRAQSIVSRIEEESRIAQEAEKQKKEDLRLLAIEKIQQAFNSCVSEEVIKDLGIEIKDKPSFGSGIIIEQKGKYCGDYSHTDVYARIDLVCDCCIEIRPRYSTGVSYWNMRQPVLEKRTSKWKNQDLCDFREINDMSLEEAILKAVFEFEQDLQKYDKARDKEQQRRIAEETERERRRLEDAAFVAKVKATDAEIRQLIEEAIAPYRPQWKEGFVLKVYKWRYCTGAVDGDFDYQEVFSLSTYMHPDEETGKLFVVTVEGDRIALEPEIHKPVIHEIVINSIESANKELGRIGFHGSMSFVLFGVNSSKPFKDRYPEDYALYWSWSEEALPARYYGSEPLGNQMKPWLRKALGLPEVPSEIHIQKP